MVGSMEVELRNLLTDLRIETKSVRAGDAATLQLLLRRALGKAQHLAAATSARGGIDPSDLSRWSPVTQILSVCC